MPTSLSKASGDNVALAFVCIARYTKGCPVTFSKKLLVQFHQNFTGMISTKCSCEYHGLFGSMIFVSVMAL
jgi:hypothetical protein